MAPMRTLRINTVYQLLADLASGLDPHAPWVNLPEYVLYRLGGRSVAEYTNATHTGLVDIATGDWSEEPGGRKLEICPKDALFPPIVPEGTVIGKLTGPSPNCPRFAIRSLIVPACHDTASAIAGIQTDLDGTAYICSGTWSLVGTVIRVRRSSTERSYGCRLHHSGRALRRLPLPHQRGTVHVDPVKQCLETWRKAGRVWDLPELIAQSAIRNDFLLAP